MVSCFDWVAYEPAPSERFWELVAAVGWAGDFEAACERAATWRCPQTKPGSSRMKSFQGHRCMSSRWDATCMSASSAICRCSRRGFSSGTCQRTPWMKVSCSSSTRGASRMSATLVAGSAQPARSESRVMEKLILRAKRAMPQPSRPGKPRSAPESVKCPTQPSGLPKKRRATNAGLGPASNQWRVPSGMAMRSPAVQST